MPAKTALGKYDIIYQGKEINLKPPYARIKWMKH